MTVRRFQLDALPPDIPTDRVDEQRLAVLRELAIRLPALGIRHELQIVGKGGTLLHLCEGVNRPSIDYDLRHQQSLAEAGSGPLAAPSTARPPECSRPAGVPTRHTGLSRYPSNGQRHWRTAGPSESAVTSTPDSCLTSTIPEFQRSNLRTHKGIPTYTSRHLYPRQSQRPNEPERRPATCTTALYGLTYHIERIDPSTRIQLHDHLAESLSDHLVREWTIDLHKDKTLSGHVEIDTMVLDIINCLETDPVVALHAHPGRTLGFFVDTEADTISLGLAPDRRPPLPQPVHLPTGRGSEPK